MMKNKIAPPSREARWALWQEAFGEGEEELLPFERTAFSPDRFAYTIECDGTLSAALYFFDCTAEGARFAYLYGIATARAYRGRGRCRALMERVHEQLRKAGYAGTLLLPREESLYGFYEKMGYRTATFLDERDVLASDTPASLREVTKEAYAARRRVLLPRGGVVQEGENLAYLATMARFYLGEDFILAASTEGDTLVGLEMLGNTARAADAVSALGCREGRIRTPGERVPFAMGLSFDATPLPTYFAFAFD